MKQNSLWRQSSLWQKIHKEVITKQAILNLDNFKSNAVNFKLALFNPETNGVRFLKTLIYNLCSSLTPEDWSKIHRVKNRRSGNPIAVKFNNQLIDLDYLQAYFEMNFISTKINLNNKKIFEIGAGYGRTCHMIISNHNIQSYHIVDLDNCLQLSRHYLKKVLTKKQFSKITFLSNEEMPEIQDCNFDLGINIDSFAEMDKGVVLNYLDYIDKSCKYFYVKNPVGKYSDKSLSSRNKRVVADAMKTGILRHVVDINNNHSINLSAQKFTKAYCPGREWKCLNSSWAKPWNYYWQALYEKKKNAHPQG